MQTNITNSTEAQSGSEQSMINQALHTRVENVLSLSGLFGFFSRCIEQEADAEFLHMLRNELRPSIEESGLQFDESFYTVPIDELKEILAEEFTGLFVAPGCVSPYASVFETGCMFKEPADKALNAYQQAGWDYKNVYSGEFPDHIGTMLGFYGILCATEADSLDAGDVESADRIKAVRESFLVEQLGRWGPGWCHLAAQAANLTFYKQILTMVEQTLWSELTQMVDRRELKALAELNKREPKRMDYDADFRKASGL